MLTENKWRILFEIPIDRRGPFYLYLCLTGFRYSKVHFYLKQRVQDLYLNLRTNIVRKAYW